MCSILFICFNFFSFNTLFRPYQTSGNPRPPIPYMKSLGPSPISIIHNLPFIFPFHHGFSHLCLYCKIFQLPSPSSPHFPRKMQKSPHDENSKMINFTPRRLVVYIYACHRDTQTMWVVSSGCGHTTVPFSSLQEHGRWLYISQSSYIYQNNSQQHPLLYMLYMTRNLYMIL